MKTILALLLASFAACLLLPACAQDLPPDVLVTASNPVDPLTAQVIELAVQFPWVVGVLSFVGALRVVFKPGMAIIRWIVSQTASKKDDEVLEQVQRHPIFAALDWLLDLITSIKTDVVKSAVQSRGSRAALMVPFILAGAFLQFCAGCATYTTSQRDVSPERTIETRVSVSTFFDSRSQLANSRATQTDKSQSASLGSLAQEASSTNLLSELEQAAHIIKLLRPTP